MSWLTHLVRPKLRDIVGAPREKAEDEWLICPRCGHRDETDMWVRALQVCAVCDHHLPMNAAERLALIFGDVDYHAIDLPKVPVDPLRFRDVRRYTDRIKEAQLATGQPEALVVCHGTIAEENVVVAVLNPDFMDGSIGTAVGEGLITAARLAVVQESPLIVVVSSTGMRLQEGALAQVQPARITLALGQVHERRLPCIVVLASPTAATIAASFAQSAHIVVAEPGAIGAPVGQPAGPEESDAAERPERPTGDGLEHTLADIVVHRRELRRTVAHLIDLLRHPRPSADVLPLRCETGAEADD